MIGHIEPMAPSSRPPRGATVVLALDGVLDAPLGVALDVLRAADRIVATRGRRAPFSARVVGCRREVQLGSGLRLRVDHAIGAAPPAPGLVVVPGVDALEEEQLEGFLAGRDAGVARDWLRAAAARGAWIAAGCTGAFLLAGTGLLDGRTATTLWALAPLFRRRFPRVDLDASRTTVCEGRFWTAGAALSMTDLALALVRHTAGAEVAELCLRYLALDTRPTQARYAMLDHLAASSPEVRRAERWIRGHLGQPMTVAGVARAVGTSSRTLARRTHETLGLPPIRLIQRLRAEQAEHLLATTRLSFEEVCGQVGYGDPSALRRVLRRELGATARALRPRPGGALPPRARPRPEPPLHRR